MPRILLATTGSLGDLNPMLAIGERLRRRGADVVVAAPGYYSQACANSGLRMVPIGNASDYVNALRYSRSMLEEQGFEQFVERLNFDGLDDLYAQLLAAAAGCDALVAPVHVVPAHLVAERLGIPYITCALGTAHLRPPAMPDAAATGVSASISRWHVALWKFRERHQLSRKVLPITSLLRDARLVLGILPKFLLSADDLRTPNLRVVGYADHRQTERMVQDVKLRAFCDKRTVAISFGSFADACDPLYFLGESVAACRALNLKCVYLSRYAPPTSEWHNAPDVMIRGDVAPGAVFPLVGAVLHHGGTGTLMAACKHPHPMVLVPFFLDQPQHAERMRELIGAGCIHARDYDRNAAAAALRAALADGELMTSQLRALMAKTLDGAEGAALEILGVLGTPAAA